MARRPTDLPQELAGVLKSSPPAEIQVALKQVLDKLALPQLVEPGCRLQHSDQNSAESSIVYAPQP